MALEIEPFTRNFVAVNPQISTVEKYFEVPYTCRKAVFLNRRAAARYRALTSIIPDRERFSWNLSF
jgi:hypothetical protein